MPHFTRFRKLERAIETIKNLTFGVGEVNVQA